MKWLDEKLVQLSAAGDHAGFWHRLPSLESLAKVLSEPNRELLAIIEDRKPRSIQELSDLSGRATSNLSRTLKTMKRFGLIELDEQAGRRVMPKVAYSRFKLEMPIVHEGPSRTRTRARMAQHAG